MGNFINLVCSVHIELCILEAKRKYDRFTFNFITKNNLVLSQFCGKNANG